MAVPKIAVIALVVIIAVPILMGYAMNLTEVTDTGYKASEDSVNVTPLLMNGEAYTYSHGNTYQLNNNIRVGSTRILPHYEDTSYARSSLNLALVEWTTGTHGVVNQPFNSFSYFYYQNDTSTASGQLTMEVWNGSTLQFSVARIHTVYYDGNGNLIYSFYTNAGDYSTITNGSANIIDESWIIYFKDGGGYDGTAFFEYAFRNGSTTDYADLSSGYYLTGYPNNWVISLPNNTRTALMTIDLDSVTDTNYSINIGYLAYIILDKKTDGLGNVTWTIYDKGNPSNYKELYYDPSGSNTYQMQLEMELVGASQVNPANNQYNVTFDFRYIGAWPSLIGEANYYNHFSIERTVGVPKGLDPTMPYISIYTDDYVSVDSTPRIRMDDALFRAFQYQVIEDQTYNPVSFKTNPSTKITDIQSFGTSIEFAGNTYTVSKDGKITVDSHQIPVNNLTFTSIPNDGGGYDNKIGNTVISTTAQPSTIKFNGQWNASISTDSMESYSYTRTEWNAGSFAWNGMDQNFLMVGLMTCLGAFISLGIYARKRGSGGIIPLMIVTGCAAAVFFIML